MTDKTIIEVTCTKCGRRQETDVWNSLNVTLDPEGKELLFQGKINQFDCQSCGHRAFMDKSFMYHDMERRIAVYYFPARALDNHDFYDGFGAEGEIITPGLPLLPSADYLHGAHIVFDMGELLRYVRFRDELSLRAGGLASGPVKTTTP